MNHPDWPLFLTAIVANTEDNTLRLVAADFLEEHGELDRAAFIRVQIALANLDASIRQEKLVGDELRWQALSLEADDLRRQEGTFLSPKSTFPRLWAEDACPELICPTPTRRGLGMSIYQERPAEFVWCRGFVDRIYCEAEV